MPPVRGIVFDVGNVLFGYDPEYILDQLLPKTPHKQLYLSELFHAQIWQDMDRGDVSREETIIRLADRHGDTHHENLACLIDNFVDHLIKIEPSHQALRLALSQYPVFILSNFQSDPYTKLEQLHPILTQVTNKVISARVGMNKPEKGIYERLIASTGLPPHSLFFIDDRPENVLAASELGIQTHLFQDPMVLLDTITTLTHS